MLVVFIMTRVSLTREKSESSLQCSSYYLSGNKVLSTFSNELHIKDFSLFPAVWFLQVYLNNTHLISERMGIVGAHE